MTWKVVEAAHGSGGDFSKLRPTTNPEAEVDASFSTEAEALSYLTAKAVDFQARWLPTAPIMSRFGPTGRELQYKRIGESYFAVFEE